MGILTDHDIYLFREGTHATLYQRLALGPGHAIALFHENGQMVARHPAKDGDVGRSFAGGRHGTLTRYAS